MKPGILMLSLAKRGAREEILSRDIEYKMVYDLPPLEVRKCLLYLGFLSTRTRS